VTLGKYLLVVVLACPMLAGCGLGPGPAERIRQQENDRIARAELVPEFDDGAEGTPGAWGRLTDASTGASFVFPAAVAPGETETVTGVDGTRFAQWWYFTEEQGLATQVDVISPFEGRGIRISLRAILRSEAGAIRSEGGSDVVITPGRPRRDGAILASPADIQWREDGERVFVRIGVFATKGMAVVVRARLAAEDHYGRARRRVEWAYDLMVTDIEVPVKPPNRSPTSEA
jgi:hypothetical protein